MAVGCLSLTSMHALSCAQVNMTDNNIGYCIMDLDKEVSHEVEAALRELPTVIRTRILY